MSESSTMMTSSNEEGVREEEEADDAVGPVKKILFASPEVTTYDDKDVDSLDENSILNVLKKEKAKENLLQDEVPYNKTVTQSVSFEVSSPANSSRSASRSTIVIKRPDSIKTLNEDKLEYTNELAPARSTVITVKPVSHFGNLMQQLTRPEQFDELYEGVADSADGTQFNKTENTCDEEANENVPTLTENNGSPEKTSDKKASPMNTRNITSLYSFISNSTLIDDEFGLRGLHDAVKNSNSQTTELNNSPFSLFKQKEITIVNTMESLENNLKTSIEAFDRDSSISSKPTEDTLKSGNDNEISKHVFISKTRHRICNDDLYTTKLYPERVVSKKLEAVTDSRPIKINMPEDDGEIKVRAVDVDLKATCAEEFRREGDKPPEFWERILETIQLTVKSLESTIVERVTNEVTKSLSKISGAAIVKKVELKPLQEFNSLLDINIPHSSPAVEKKISFATSIVAVERAKNHSTIDHAPSYDVIKHVEPSEGVAVRETPTQHDNVSLWARVGNRLSVPVVNCVRNNVIVLAWVPTFFLLAFVAYGLLLKLVPGI